MSDQYYIQCRLKKENPGKGFYYMTTNIPEKFAHKDNVLKIKIEGNWSKGWVVIDTWGRKSKEEINERSRHYLHQRKASDI